MAVVEAATGVRLNLDWLARPHAMVRRPAKVPSLDAPPGGFSLLDPDLDARLRLSAPSIQALAIQRTVTDVPARHELLNEPSVRAGLDLLASGQIADLWPSQADLVFCPVRGGGRDRFEAQWPWWGNAGRRVRDYPDHVAPALRA